MAALRLQAPCVGEWMREGPARENRAVGIVVDAGGDG